MNDLGKELNYLLRRCFLTFLKRLHILRQDQIQDHSHQKYYSYTVLGKDCFDDLREHREQLRYLGKADADT